MNRQQVFLENIAACKIAQASDENWRPQARSVIFFSRFRRTKYGTTSGRRKLGIFTNKPDLTHKKRNEGNQILRLFCKIGFAIS